MKDSLIIGGKTITNRLFVGTGKFENKKIIKNVLDESKAEVVTVALRRIDMESKKENILDYIPKHCMLMTNTSGARNAKEAIRIARLARAAGCGNWIKIEVISDNKYLFPDNYETLKATEVLSKEGFVVFPYVNPDLIIARQLEKSGAAAVMPLGSPIGTNRGFRTKEIVRIIVKELTIPVIVDAGIGKPSEAAECMELGCGAVLVNTAIATAANPVGMAEAFSKAVDAGRIAYLSGLAVSVDRARASSPLTGFLRSNES
ncbi:MAG: thiazole synthase [Candidatus Omnitrophica bacterium]|nr:thiazole synthase [Candidatus Omnitrophota bacterium]MCK5493938.1 thiazole synthase [Candidatus Omnitrophota bacterium]